MKCKYVVTVVWNNYAGIKFHFHHKDFFSTHLFYFFQNLIIHQVALTMIVANKNVSYLLTLCHVVFTKLVSHFFKYIIGLNLSYIRVIRNVTLFSPYLWGSFHPLSLVLVVFVK